MQPAATNLLRTGNSSLQIGFISDLDECRATRAAVTGKQCILSPTELHTNERDLIDTVRSAGDHSKTGRRRPTVVYVRLEI